MASSTRKKKHHPLRWVLEPLMEDPSYLERPMFGCLACYLHGRLSLLLASGDEPWNGLLIPTDHQFHEAIRQDFTGVLRHPVLKKWLYLPVSDDNFETEAMELVEAIRLNDPRLGVAPKERKSRKKKN